MERILKIEAFSGASGDMFLSALAQLTNCYDELKNLPQILNFNDEAEILISEVTKNGIVCKHVKVIEIKHQHHHRHLTDIQKLINTSALNQNAKKIANDIFNIIGKAEAEVHSIPIEKIHFHEIGAVDSIIDICGTAFLLDKLDIKKSYITTLNTGKGFVNTAHGKLPIPAPATKLILEGIPYNYGEEEGEKLTPTGAAIIKYLNPSFNQITTIDLKTGYGAGTKDFIIPNVLRLSISEISDQNQKLIMIETNLDDMNNEFLGIQFQNQLLTIGAIDFYLTQVIMKKGRPGIVLNIICNQSNLEEISNFVLNFTSTLGIRYYPIQRIELKREYTQIETEFGKFNVKVSRMPNGEEKIKAESSEIMESALKNNINPNNISNLIRERYEKNN